MADKLKRFVIDNRKNIIAIGIVVVVGVAAGLIIVFLNSSAPSSEELQQSVEQQTDKVTTNVADKITLPDETPIMSVVVDKTQLEGDIFKNAENGDQVLIYEEAGLMVIYRESTDEIIATGSVGTGSVGGENNVPTGVDQ